MENLISIFLFISIFLIVTALLYSYMLKDKEIEKRMNYYLDIENKYKMNMERKVKSEETKELLKKCNEYIREIMKKGLPSKNQKEIKQQLIAAGINIKPEEYVMSRFFLALVIAGTFSLLFNNALFVCIGIVLGFYLPKMWVGSKRKKRVELFNDGLADMITTIVGSLKAGYSFSQALKTVAEESESPIKEEIEVLLHELNYGITMEEALYNLKNRMPSTDLELMIHAIVIQRQIGGNLSIILDIIINTIRERKKIERQVKTLTAQGRLSGKIIGSLPFVIALVMFTFNRTMMMDFVSNRYGQIAIAVGVLMSLSGFALINKLTKIEV